MAASDDGESEDPETFWARRASTIQHYYNQWDCNQLSNETFTGQLQQILGTRVDMSAVDSETVRLTNQHRYARNLKFAQLMSALRIDARNTKSGFPVPGSPTNTYCPSEAPSESASYAAGRPSSKHALSLSSGCWQSGLGGGTGRKHYTPSESNFGDDDRLSTAGSIRREPKPRTPAPFAELSDLEGRSAAPPPRQFAPYAYDNTAPAPKQRPISGGGYNTNSQSGPSPAPFAMGGNFERDYRRAPIKPIPEGSELGPSDPNFFYSRRAQPQQNDGGSQYGAQSESMSVADSERSHFTARDRGGHGNILTWGGDSRNITPTKKRQGRQLAVEEDGQTKASTCRGIFPPSP